MYSYLVGDITTLITNKTIITTYTITTTIFYNPEQVNSLSLVTIHLITYIHSYFLIMVLVLPRLPLLLQYLLLRPPMEGYLCRWRRQQTASRHQHVQYLYHISMSRLASGKCRCISLCCSKYLHILQWSLHHINPTFSV